MADQATKQKLRFNPDWRVSLLALLLLPCLLAMGFWQLSRAEEKSELKKQFDLRREQAPVAISKLSAQRDLRYRRVLLKGEFVKDRIIFLDNQIHRGQFGYDVVSLFKLLDTNKYVLVNRGWVAGDRSRRTLPEVDTVAGIVEITGEVHVPAGKMLSLANHQPTGWPRVVQALDVEGLSQEMGLNLFTYSVRLDADMTNAFISNWVVVNVQPEKHTAYAFQWFAMAATLVIIALLANTNLWSLIKRRSH